MAGGRIDFYAPTTVQVGGAENLPATNELPIDMYSKMLNSFPAVTPLTVIASRMAENPMHNYRIDWIEQSKIPTTLVVAFDEASVPSVASTVYFVDNAYTAVLDTLLYNPRTFDLRRVSTAPSGDTSLSVTPSQGGTTTSSIWKAMDVVHVLPPALAENDANTRRISVANTNVYNLVQVVKMQFGLTRVMNAMDTYFGGRGSKRAELKAQKWYEFREKQEKLLYFGGRSSSGTAPATQRTMGGLTHYLRSGTLYKDFNGLMTETGFRNLLGDYKDQNPDATQVWVFAAGNVCDIVSDFGAGKVRMSPDSKTYGLDIMQYKSRGITAKMVALPLLNDPVCAGWGWILDMERVKMRWLDKPIFFPEMLNVGESEIITDTYRSASSLLIGNESRHAMFVGADL